MSDRENKVFAVRAAGAGGLSANGSPAAPIRFFHQKQMHLQSCAGATLTSGGGLGGSSGPGFPPSPPVAVGSGEGVTCHIAAEQGGLATTSSGGNSNTTSNAGGGTGYGIFGRCLCKGAAGGSSSRARGSQAKSLKCITCGNLSHMSCYPGVVGSSAQKFVCSTCRIKRLDPFYPVEDVLWETHLEGSHYSVDISAHVLRKWRAEGKEVVVRCMQVDQPLLYQTWPKSIQISINGRTEETVAAPSWEHKRRDMPIVITQYLKNGKNKVEFWWTNYEESKPFHLAILLCTYSSPESLAKTLELRSHVGEADARQRVLSIVVNKNGNPSPQQNEEDDDVTCMEVTRRIKLLCPITFMRIDVPCRGANCMHLQCFDLSGYLLVTRNTKAFNTRWKCPECQLYVRPDELVIDDFVLRILKETSEDATVIELEADGSYRVVSEQELKEESKRAEAQRLRAAGACRVKRAIDEETTAARSDATGARKEDGPSKKAFEIVEMLSSSEDEEDALAMDSNSTAPISAQTRPPLSATSTAASATDTTPGAVAAAAGARALDAAWDASAPAAKTASPVLEGGSVAVTASEASTARALPPSLVSSLLSAAAAASAAAAGGMLFSSVAPSSVQHRQQQLESHTGYSRDDRCTYSPEEEGEECDDEDDSSIRVGRFHKRLRRTALSPASSPPSPALAGSSESTLEGPPQERQQIAPTENLKKSISVASFETNGSLEKKIPTRAGVRGAAASSLRVALPKAQTLAAVESAPAPSEQLESQQHPSAEGDDIVVISSDDEDEPMAASWTPISTPHQQRRQQRRQQEQEKRRLQEEKREEHRKLVAQAAATAQKHARGEEVFSEGSGLLEAGTKDRPNVAFSDISALTVPGSPSARASREETLLNNVQLSYSSTPSGPATAHSVSNDSASEMRVGDRAAELLQLLLEAERQELEQREKLHMEQIEHLHPRASLRRLTSLRSGEDTGHHAPPPFWHASDQAEDSDRSNASTSKGENLAYSGSRSCASSIAETAAGERGRELSDGTSRKAAAMTALTDADSATAGESSATTGHVSADAAPERNSSTVHHLSATEQASIPRRDDSNAEVVLAPDSFTVDSFHFSPYSYPHAGLPRGAHPADETSGEAVARAVSPPARPDSLGECNTHEARSACNAPRGDPYGLHINSMKMVSLSKLQQQQTFGLPIQQETEQQSVPYSGVDDNVLPTHTMEHSAIDGHELERYSKTPQQSQPQHTSEQLQQLVQQKAQPNSLLLQYAGEQRRMEPQQQQRERSQQQAAQRVRRLQQACEPLLSSHKTATAAGAVDEQLTRRDPPTTDTREKEHTRIFIGEDKVTAAENEESSSSRRSSARGGMSRSSCPQAGRTGEDNQGHKSESLSHAHPSARGVPADTPLFKADATSAPARAGPGSGPSSSRANTDPQGPAPHEHRHSQQQEMQQQQQQSLGGTMGRWAGDIGPTEAEAAAVQAPGIISGVRAESAAPDLNARSTPPHSGESKAATAPPSARTVFREQASSSGLDRKRTAAGESCTTANAGGASLTKSKELQRTQSSTPEATQGSIGTRKGPRMSLPPRSCVAELRLDPAGTSRPASPPQRVGTGTPSAVVSTSVTSTSSTLAIPSCASRVVTASATASHKDHASLPPGATPAGSPAVTTFLARSAEGAAASASLAHAAAVVSPAANTGLLRSPTRRLLVPPVPPPLSSRSVKHPGSARNGGQEECIGSRANAQHCLASTGAHLQREQGNSTSYTHSSEEDYSCVPATADATVRVPAPGGPISAKCTVVPAPPAPTSVPDEATAVLGGGKADTGLRAAGRLATFRGGIDTAASLIVESGHRSTNTDDYCSTAAFSDAASCRGGQNRRRNDDAEGQHGASSTHTGSSGRTCNTDRINAPQEDEPMISNVSNTQTAASSGSTSVTAAIFPRRFRVDHRRHTCTSGEEDESHAESRHSKRDGNLVEGGKRSCSRGQSSSAETLLSECSSSPNATAAWDRGILQEADEVASCSATLEPSEGERADLLRQPLVEERRPSATQRENRGQASAESAASMRRERNASRIGLDGGLCMAGEEGLPPMQTAGVADTVNTAGLQRRASAVSAAATTDEATPLPSQAAGGRCRVSVVLTHHAANHVRPPPAVFFPSVDSVTPSPSAFDFLDPGGPIDGEKAHKETGDNRSISDSGSPQSFVTARQIDEGTDLPCLGALSGYGPAVSKDFHAFSRGLCKAVSKECLDATADSTVAAAQGAADFFQSKCLPTSDVAPPLLNNFSHEYKWRVTFWNDSCGKADGTFPSSVPPVSDRTTGAGTSRTEEELLPTELEECCVRGRHSEAQMEQQQSSEIRLGDAESRISTNREDTESPLTSGMPRSHISSKMRERQPFERPQGTRSATPRVGGGSAVFSAETNEAHERKGHGKIDADAEGNLYSRGYVPENADEAAAKLSKKIPVRDETNFRNIIKPQIAKLC